MKKINVLILGSGGREHAIAWKICKSKSLNNLYVAPGNSGTELIANNLSIDIQNYSEIKKSIIKNNIELLIIGPEDPLVAGLHNTLSEDKDILNLTIIGPKKEGAKLEGSKLFAKKFMKKYNIPTADFKNFNKDNFLEARNYLANAEPPFVIKADGLAAGKGVFICDNLDESEKIIEDIIMKSKFGSAGEEIVIETFLQGIELSVFILTNGDEYKILPSAKDYKRIGENDTGLNTGGMGAVSPVPFLDHDLMNKIKSRIIEPTLKGLKKERIEYSGFLFFGLINVDNNPFVIEYNVRLGDPETQVIIPRIESDLLDLLVNIDSPNEFKRSDLLINPESTTTVILTSGGYPEKYISGYPVEGINTINDAILFHAGLKLHEKKYITNGGRVLAVTGKGNSIQEAIKKSYRNINLITFPNAYFRKDIGLDMIK
jgi:phosphoribosylamine--glycine ligase